MRVRKGLSSVVYLMLISGWAFATEPQAPDIINTRLEILQKKVDEFSSDLQKVKPDPELVDWLEKHPVVADPVEAKAFFDTTKKLLAWDTFSTFVKLNLAVGLSIDESGFILEPGKFRVLDQIAVIKNPKFEKALKYFAVRLSEADLAAVRVFVVSDAKLDGQEASYYWTDSQTFPLKMSWQATNPDNGQVVGSESYERRLKVSNLPQLRIRHLERVFGSKHVILIPKGIYEDETEDGITKRNGTMVRALSFYRQALVKNRNLVVSEFPTYKEEFFAASQAKLKQDIEAEFKLGRFNDAVLEIGNKLNLAENEVRRQVADGYMAGLQPQFDRFSSAPNWGARIEEANFYLGLGFSQQKYLEFVANRLSKNSAEIEISVKNELEEAARFKLTPASVEYLYVWLAHWAAEQMKKQQK